ncbi:hypothetical protein MTR67_051700 [Solanum verrucosum]|uniref:Uncharacterized protein n=1 Tax=Solanum verrucosum TaxID=315347 RepID=A0AAF0V4E3_SOLVR|nr:hypothetical protein MTR67_051700 [Solanum verrucosum]
MEREVDYRPVMIEREWLKLLRGYDMSFLFHPGKANVVAYSLSRLSMGSTAHAEEEQREFARDVHRLARLGVSLMDSTKRNSDVEYV